MPAVVPIRLESRAVFELVVKLYRTEYDESEFKN
jgi:hypothetical protein